MSNGQQPLSDPSAARQAELEAAYAVHKDATAPYKDIEIRTSGEIQWILRQRRWVTYYALPPGAQHVNLSGALFQNADLSRVDLNNANLSGASLRNADLTWAHLSNTNLSGADFSAANLSWATLDRANLSGANLSQANLREANLYTANVDETNLDQTVLNNTDLLLIRGRPHWPTIEQEEASILYLKAISITTTADELAAMAWQWPGIMMQQAIAANPNTPHTTLSELAQREPGAFMRNPVLPMLFLENPHWLDPEDAQAILQAFADQSVAMTTMDLGLLRLIQHCAAAAT